MSIVNTWYFRDNVFAIAHAIEVLRTAGYGTEAASPKPWC
jgi:hypothetical protein